MADTIVQDLIDAGVHFGHRASRWNPKMASYIFGRKNLIHIIDVRETIRNGRELAGDDEVGAAVKLCLPGNSTGATVGANPATSHQAAARAPSPRFPARRRGGWTSSP